MDLAISEEENRYFKDLFKMVDTGNIGKISAQKANSLFNSADKNFDVSQVCIFSFFSEIFSPKPHYCKIDCNFQVQKHKFQYCM